MNTMTLQSPGHCPSRLKNSYILGVLWSLRSESLWHRPAGLVEDAFLTPGPLEMTLVRLGAQGLVPNQRFDHVVSPSTCSAAPQRHGRERLVKAHAHAQAGHARQSAETLSSFSSSLSRNSGSFALPDGSPPSAQDVQDVLPHLTPKQLAEAVWSFAKHEVKPTQELMDAVANEIHSKLPQFRGQDLSNTLWAFAMLRYQPTAEWWADFEKQVYGALTELSDRELANLLWGFAVLGQHSSWVLDSLLAHSCCHGFAGYSASSLHLMVWSLGKLHHAPSEQWLAGFLPAAQAAFFRFAPTELANVVWALAKLGVAVPAAWLDAFLLVAQWRFPSFSPRLLSIVAWSTATLNHRPQQEWLVCFEEQIRSKFLEFSGHELACVAWSLRKFGFSTPDNAVFYMLQKQQRFLDADFEILANPKLLRQVLGWKLPEAGGGGGGGSGIGGGSSAEAGP